MGRYDNIEYSVNEGNAVLSEQGVTFTEKDGFITSQQYCGKDVKFEISQNSLEENNLVDIDKNIIPEINIKKENVLTLQLVVCILIAVSAFLIKSFGGETYEKIRQWYFNQMNNSIIIDIKNENNAQFLEDKTETQDW